MIPGRVTFNLGPASHKVGPADARVSTAEKEYNRRIKAKTNPDRKSPQKYQLIKGVHKG